MRTGTGSAIRRMAGLAWVTVAMLTLAAGTAAAQTDYYVDAARPDNDGDGTSWDTAKQTLQAAVGLAADDDTIWVRAGIYGVPAQEPIVVTNGITIRSEIGGLDGAEVTIVEGAGTSATGNSRVFTLNHADAELYGLTVRNGRATGSGNDGGGIHMTGGLVSHCILTNNTTSQHSDGGIGAGIFMDGGIVTNSLILDNSTGGNSSPGGGISMTGNALVTHSVIAGNTTPGGYQNVGGGVRMVGTDPLLRNSLVRDNSAGTQSGGGVIGGVVQNCTIVGNHGGGAGGVSGSTVINSIVYFNTGNETAVENHSGSTFTYSCTTPLPAGTGNTALNPEFADPDDGNDRLMPASPARDSGTNQTWMAGSVDLDGNPRIFNDTVDMGAFELHPGVLVADFTADVQLGSEPLQVVLTAYVVGTNMTSLYYQWDIGNTGDFNVEGYDKAIITNAFNAGVHDVRLVVTNAASETSTRIREDYILVTGSTLYVDDGNPGATFPYSTWATAAATIADALAIASDGTTVMVTNGIYGITEQLEIMNGVALQSVNGPDVTIIEQTSGNIRIVRMEHPDAVLDGFTIRDGSLGASGVGIYMVGGVVQNCIVTNNLWSTHAGTFGAGIYVDGGIVSNTLVTANGGSGNSSYGGGVHLRNGALLTHSRITGNALTGGNFINGGGVHFNDASSIVRNCLIAGNSVSNGLFHGGGVFGSGSVQSSTIVSNSASGVGGGVVNSTVINSIVYFNTGNETPVDNHSGATFTYSCTTPLPAGTENTALDPEFVDAGAHDYRITSVSPAREAGMNQTWMTGSVDIDGNPRIFNGTVDMGAYELHPGALECGFTADVLVGVAPLEIVLTASVSATNTTSLFYRWDLNDNGIIDVEGPDRATVTNTYGLGLHNIRLQVSNAAAEISTATRTDYIIATGPTLYVVKGNAGAAAPYSTWATAAANIADALSLATDGTLVLASNGIYGVTEQLYIANAITLQSVNGADATIIEWTSGNIRLVRMAHPDAIVDGFTIRNAFFSGSGAGIFMVGGLVRNCIVTNNVLNGGTQRGAGIYVDGGIVSNCLVIANSAPQNSCYGGGVHLRNGALLTHSRITGNSVTASWQSSAGGVHVNDAVSIVRNCLVDNNSTAHNTGGGVMGGTVENCTIVHNSAGGSGGGTHNSTVINSIVYFNSAGSETNYSGGSFTYSCTTPLPAGDGNIDDDPCFVDAANRNFRPALTPVLSPAINAGYPGPYTDNLAWIATEGAVDLDGDPRLQNRRVNMGAYEIAIPPPGSLFQLR